MRADVMRRIGMVAAIVGIVVFALGGAAFAADGPTPPKLGDPVGSNISPHGGYSASTNYCLQCHTMHDAPADYALLASSTVTATCNTCHGLPAIGASSPTGAREPLEPDNPAIPGTAASRAAYTVTDGQNAIHGIGSATPPGETGITMTLADWSFPGRGQRWNPTGDATTPAETVRATGGGLYCASCHTPHGDFGQLVNAEKVLTTDATGDWSTVRVVDWKEGTIIWWDPPGPPSWKQVSIHYDTSAAGGVPSWELCDLSGGEAQPVTSVDNAIDTVPVGSCYYAQATDTDRQLVSLYGYKLLSQFPNHTYSAPKSWGTDKYNHDVAVWCGACHVSRVPSEFGGTYHNHPTGCTACHGNPADGSSADFPHTSTLGEFLVNYPDALCITCHTSGTLP